jgi:hypothetical protein
MYKLTLYCQRLSDNAYIPFSGFSLIENINGIYEQRLYSLDIASHNLSNASITPIYGSNNLIIYANDTLNNWNSTSLSFYFDNIKPTIDTVSKSPSCLEQGNAITFSWNINDNLDIDYYWFNITSPTGRNYTFYNTNTVPEIFQNETGAWVLKITANDTNTDNRAYYTTYYEVLNNNSCSGGGGSVIGGGGSGGGSGALPALTEEELKAKLEALKQPFTETPAFAFEQLLLKPVIYTLTPVHLILIIFSLAIAYSRREKKEGKVLGILVFVFITILIISSAGLSISQTAEIISERANSNLENGSVSMEQTPTIVDNVFTSTSSGISSIQSFFSNILR